MPRPQLYIDSLPLDVKLRLVPMVRARAPVKKCSDAIARSEYNARDTLTKLRIQHVLPVNVEIHRIIEDENVKVMNCDNENLLLYTADDRGYVLLEMLCDYIGDSITHLVFKRSCVPFEYSNLVAKCMPNIVHLSITWCVPKVSSSFAKEKASCPAEFISFKANELDAILSACPNLNTFEFTLVDAVCDDVFIRVLVKHIHRITSLSLNLGTLSSSLLPLWNTSNIVLDHLVLNFDASAGAVLALGVLRRIRPTCDILNSVSFPTRLVDNSPFSRLRRRL